MKGGGAGGGAMSHAPEVDAKRTTSATAWKASDAARGWKALAIERESAEERGHCGGRCWESVFVISTPVILYGG